MKKFCKEISLALLYPELAKEWDYEKNYPLRPEDVFAHSGKAAWWNCNKEHSYNMMISNRSNSHGAGCPYCSGNRVCNDNCLATLNPELSKEWDYEKNYPLTPRDVTVSSHKIVYWKCKNKHCYDATIQSRSEGNGCPFCSGHRACKDNCLATLNPRLAKEWDYEKNYPLTPEDVSSGSAKKVGWICEKHHKWEASISRRNYGDRCPYCSNRRIYNDNCLGTVNPKLSKEWNYSKNGKLTPYDVFPWSGIKVYWSCNNGHTYDMAIACRSAGQGCPYCSNKRVCRNNCLAIVNPKLAKEWHPTKNGKLTPHNVVCGGQKKAWWECEEGHEWQAVIYERSHGTGCPYCSGQKLCEDNCLATVNPKLAKEWDYERNFPLTPRDVGSGSKRKVYWGCNKGHKWEATIQNRNDNGSGCPYCSGRKACEDNCLATVNPKLAKEWDYERNGNLTPKDVTGGSGKKVGWKCENCDYKWFARISDRKNSFACPSCSVNKIKLKNGVTCDSNPEAYYCLTELEKNGIKFKHHVKIGLGARSCDFYIPSRNEYIEVTSYNKNSVGYGGKIWPEYHKNILRKKRHITKVLKAKFKFIQLKLTAKQIQYVRENSI